MVVRSGSQNRKNHRNSSAIPSKHLEVGLWVVGGLHPAAHPLPLRHGDCLGRGRGRPQGPPSPPISVLGGQVVGTCTIVSTASPISYDINCSAHSISNYYKQDMQKRRLQHWGALNKPTTTRTRSHSASHRHVRVQEYVVPGQGLLLGPVRSLLLMKIRVLLPKEGLCCARLATCHQCRVLQKRTHTRRCTPRRAGVTSPAPSRPRPPPRVLAGMTDWCHDYDVP
jgi:hypothetical protein